MNKAVELGDLSLPQIFHLINSRSWGWIAAIIFSIFGVGIFIGEWRAARATNALETESASKLSDAREGLEAAELTLLRSKEQISSLETQLAHQSELASKLDGSKVATLEEIERLKAQLGKAQVLNTELRDLAEASRIELEAAKLDLKTQREKITEFADSTKLFAALDPSQLPKDQWEGVWTGRYRCVDGKQEYGFFMWDVTNIGSDRLRIRELSARKNVEDNTYTVTAKDGELSGRSSNGRYEIFAALESSGRATGDWPNYWQCGDFLAVKH